MSIQYGGIRHCGAQQGKIAKSTAPPLCPPRCWPERRQQPARRRGRCVRSAAGPLPEGRPAVPAVGRGAAAVGVPGGAGRWSGLRLAGQGGELGGGMLVLVEAPGRGCVSERLAAQAKPIQSTPAGSQEVVYVQRCCPGRCSECMHSPCTLGLLTAFSWAQLTHGPLRQKRQRHADSAMALRVGEPISPFPPSLPFPCRWPGTGGGRQWWCWGLALTMPPTWRSLGGWPSLDWEAPGRSSW